MLPSGKQCCHPQVGVIRLQLMHQCIYTNYHGKFEEKHLLLFTTHFKTSAFCQNNKKTRSHFFGRSILAHKSSLPGTFRVPKPPFFPVFFRRPWGPWGFTPLGSRSRTHTYQGGSQNLLFIRSFRFGTHQRTQQHGVLVMGWDGRRWTIFLMGSWIGWIFFV